MKKKKKKSQVYEHHTNTAYNGYFIVQVYVTCYILNIFYSFLMKSRE